MSPHALGLALPMSLMVCSLMSLAVMGMQHLADEQPSMIQARLDELRQREWAWVGLQAALTDVHAPRGDARHPLNTDSPTQPSESTTGEMRTAQLPDSVNQWRRHWTAQAPGRCQDGLCTDLGQGSRTDWLQRGQGIEVPVQRWSSWPLMYWIEPLLVHMPDSDAPTQLAFRITVRSGPQVWQGWWRPDQPWSSPAIQGQWLSLLTLEDP